MSERFSGKVDDTLFSLPQEGDHAEDLDYSDLTEDEQREWYAYFAQQMEEDKTLQKTVGLVTLAGLEKKVFVSHSHGRTKDGRMRARKNPRDVYLVGVARADGSRTFSEVDPRKICGKMDRIAHDYLDHLPEQDRYSTLESWITDCGK